MRSWNVFFVGISSSALLAVSLCISVLATALLPAGRRGPFMSLRQSLESDTGVNYHSLAKRFPARLQTRSPPHAFRLPTRPSPHTPTARLRPVSTPACSPPPPPPPFLERKSATAICTPGLWITLNLKGCKARYQRVIRHAVEPLEGRVVRTEGELPTQEVVAEGEDGPPDG